MEPRSQASAGFEISWKAGGPVAPAALELLGGLPQVLRCAGSLVLFLNALFFLIFVDFGGFRSFIRKDRFASYVDRGMLEFS